MVVEVFSIELPVGEKLIIKKNRIMGKQPSDKRMAVVSGIHGDEFEGQYICYELTRRIMEEQDKLTGIVDVYPALNPLSWGWILTECFRAMKRERPWSGWQLQL